MVKAHGHSLELMLEPLLKVGNYGIATFVVTNALDKCETGRRYSTRYLYAIFPAMCTVRLAFLAHRATQHSERAILRSQCIYVLYMRYSHIGLVH